MSRKDTEKSMLQNYEGKMGSERSMDKSALKKTSLEEDSILEETEEMIVLRSICDVNLPKFLAEDITLFNFVINDIFPRVTTREPEYDLL
jgi:hypothetical protein